MRLQPDARFRAHLIAAACVSALCMPAWAGVEANQASLADLEAMPGVGTAVAERIVEARTSRPFADWADLIRRVKGIGPGNAARLSAQGLTVNGAAFTPTAERR